MSDTPCMPADGEEPATPEAPLSPRARQFPNLTNAGKGRARGSLNKTTVVMKEAILSVYADLQAIGRGEEREGGAHAHYLHWAQENPTEFYKQAARLLPLQVHAEVHNRVAVAVFKGIND